MSLWLALCCLLWAMACSPANHEKVDETPFSDAGPQDGVVGDRRACQNDLDCPNPQHICKSGVCVDRRGCKVDADCKDPAHPKCLDGICDVLPPECRADTDCQDASKPYCLEGRCQAKTCLVDADCSEPLRPFCVAGVCAASASCTKDLDCKNPKAPLCRDGLCVANRDCVEHADCKNPQAPVCLSGSCVAECLVDKDCKDLSRPWCVDRRCVSGAQCFQDWECREPALPVCRSGRCSPMGVECFSSFDCKEGARPLCFERRCIAAECRRDADCMLPNKPRCQEYRCVPDCQSDVDCGSGQQCANGRCTPRTECQSDADCVDPARSICFAGVCSPPLPECQENLDCSDISKPNCASNQCVLEAVCQQNSDCTESARPLCVSGVCAPKSGCKLDSDCRDKSKPFCDVRTGKCGQCASQRDCASWQFCHATALTCAIKPGSCASDFDCRGVLGKPFCVANVCAPCRTGSDCKSLHECQANQCVFVGCKSDTECKPRVCSSTKKICVECTTDRHCGSNARCDQTLSRCVLRAGCTTDSDCSKSKPACLLASKSCVECTDNSYCPSGYQCNQKTNLCVNCTSTSDCLRGQVCLGGKCTVGCVADKDCRVGKICQQNQCVDGCRRTGDCQSGYTCLNNLCVAVCSPDTTGNGYDLKCRLLDSSKRYCKPVLNQCVQCFANTHCQSYGKDRPVCDLKTHTCVCNGDSDCTASSNSTSGACETTSRRCVECTNDTHCRRGYICNASNVCELGCRKDLDCAGGQKCSSNKCVECTSDTDCQGRSRPVCWKGACVECGADKDCPTQTVCEPALKLCYRASEPIQCQPCAQGARCAVGHQCVRAVISSKAAETVCLRQCKANADCPRGFTCGSPSRPSLQGYCWPASGTLSSSYRSCRGVFDIGKVCDSKKTTTKTCGLSGITMNTYYTDAFCSTLEGGVCRVGCRWQGDSCPVGYRCGCPSGYVPYGSYSCRSASGTTLARCVR
ncbi:MAG: hypothetical protein CL920_05195 [Deltaproteobacteria bacterium]|nr:hypothetical protein [Deltaproteobacteria bacterium]MBU48077.1 hypothetical protein [Deltaproteobacteria bacterium]